MQPSKGKKKILGVKKKDPIKINKDFSNLGDFINKEQSSIKGMKKKPITPIVNKEKENARNELRESMKKINLNEIKKKEVIEEPLNSTASKFEGFSKATKFTDSGTGFHPNPEGTELNNSLSTSKIGTSILTKPEPFVIKKFAEQNKNEKAKEILNDLNKSEKKKPSTPKINIAANEINISKKIETDNKFVTGGKKFEAKLSKVEPLPVQNNKKEEKKEEEDEIYDEYDDFVKDDEELKKLENKNEIKNQPEEDNDEFNTDGKIYNNVDDEIYRPPKREAPKSKRELTLQRVNDLKGAIEIGSEMLNLFSMDYIKEDDDIDQFSKKKEEQITTDTIGVNTDPM